MSERFPLLLVEEDGVFDWVPITDVGPAWAAMVQETKSPLSNSLMATLAPDENKVYVASSTLNGVALSSDQVVEFAKWLIANVKRMSEEVTA